MPICGHVHFFNTKGPCGGYGGRCRLLTPPWIGVALRFSLAQPGGAAQARAAAAALQPWLCARVPPPTAPDGNVASRSCSHSNRGGGGDEDEAARLWGSFPSVKAQPAGGAASVLGLAALRWLAAALER